jgi:ATP-binding cassette, subfamily B, bacterial
MDTGRQPRVSVNRYRRILGYALPYRSGWALTIIVTLAATALSLAQPWPMKALVDYVLSGRPMPPDSIVLWLLPGAASRAGLLAWVIAALLGLFVIGSLCDAVLTYNAIRVGQRMVYDLARDLFVHLHRHSLRFHARTPVGDSMTRINADTWCAYQLVDALILTPGRALVFLGGLLVIMGGMHWRFTLLVAGLAPLMGISAFFVGRRVRASSRARREIESSMQAHVQQTLSGIQVVQAFAQEERQLGHFRDFAMAAIRTRQRTLVLKSLAGLWTGLISTLGTAIVLFVGAKHALEGSLTVGSLLVFLSYLASLQSQFRTLAGAYMSVQDLRAQIDRVMEILASEPEVVERRGAVGLGAVRGEVRLEGVTFGYEPGRAVLEGVSLEAMPGEAVAIVGATGAGKSTLVSLIPRFFDPWSGRVTLDGRDVREVRLKDLRERVSLVLQDPFLFPLTVAENIAYGRPGAGRSEIEAAARAANAHRFIERLPSGYDTVIGERGSTLSGGERQRISIARALLKDSPVLILDEPTSALDAETEALLMEALGRLMAGRTAFIIAHRLSTVRHAYRVIVLDGGTVAEMGTHQELIMRGGLYAEFCRLQFGTPL